jgi:hypothetical protein
MALSEREEREFALIAEALRRDDPGLARTLDQSAASPNSLLEWLALAGIAIGLGITTVGVHWHVVAVAVLGVTIAAVAPIVLGVLLSPHRHRH